MKILRISSAALLAWLAVFFNVERLFAPIDLASFVYVLAAAGAMVILAFPQLARARLPWLLLPCIPAVVIIKAALGYGITGSQLPLTVTEICSVATTLSIAWWFSRELEELRDGVAQLFIGSQQDWPTAFHDGQSQMYREVRRARAFHRPLALLSVAAAPHAIKPVVNRLILDLQREVAQRHLMAQMVNLIVSHTRGCDLITHYDGRFLVLLPEVDGKGVEQLISNLEAAAHLQLDLELNIGVALLPDDEVTFVKLLERAESTIQRPRPHHRGANGKAYGSGQNGHGSAPSVPDPMPDHAST